MIAFAGVLAVLTFGLLAGLPFAGPRQPRVSSKLFTSLFVSAWMSWVAVAVLHLVGLEGRGPAVAVVAVVGVGLVWSTWYQRHEGVVVDRLDLLAVPVAMSVAVVIPAWLLITGHGAVDLVFTEFDAVVSWNRWAMELAQGDFSPIGNLYPLLLPGQWSLAYRLQGTSDVWIFAKLSLFLIVAMATLAPVVLAQEGRYRSATVIACFLVAFLFLDDRFTSAVMTGYMDGPLVLVLVSFLSWYVVVVARLDDERGVAPSVLVALAVAAGATSLVKQGGFVAPLLVIGLALALALRRRIGASLALAVSALSIAPLASFVVIYRLSSSDMLGNLDRLRVLVERDSQGVPPTLFGLVEVATMLPLWIFALLALLALSNVRRLRTWVGAAGAALMLTAAASSLAFGACCSYDARNGWWILALVAGSAALGVIELGTPRSPPRRLVRVPTPTFVITVVGVALALALVAGASLSNDRVRALQSDAQWTIVAPRLATLLQRHVAESPEDAIIVTPLTTVRWLPGLDGTTVLCRFDDEPCVRDALASSDDAYVLTAPRRNRAYAFLADELPARPLVGKAVGFSLRGPWNTADEP